MNPLEAYLIHILEIWSSGSAVRETSYYVPLANLFEEVGKTLKPKVRAILQLKNRGAGLPDGGFFTPDQLHNAEKDAPLLGQIPARGVVEIKGFRDDVKHIAETKQVNEYLSHYGQVLVTNYREFLLLGRSPQGKPMKLEGFQLAGSEVAFRSACAHPKKTAETTGYRFVEYLRRVMLHNAPLNTPRDVAFFLASYARDARIRVDEAGDLPALAAIRTALEQALGIRFEEAKGEHFFRSTLVQTIFYGVFSAWVLWHKESPQRVDAFDWKAAAWTLHVPMIRALFEQIATPTKLGPLGLVEPLDWTAASLNRVDRFTFFQKFQETHAVQYFYEPFLEAFDPELRKEMGVWYTPPEIVEYMVARVDKVLREDLRIPDGLADRRVFVLDPCCGTGAYLVAVLRQIVLTLKEEKGEGALAEFEAKEAAMQRVFGFEILPAPFVVAHLQIGLLLQNLAVPLDDSKDERAGIFLTNSLTGWDFIGENPHLKNWPELELERAGATRVKQEKPILVILGNPPYNAYAGVSPEEEQGLVEPYKEGLISKWGIKKFNLDDLYIRFFRLAERRIAERTGKGIICYISNYSWISDPSFVVMRQRFLTEFDSFWFDSLNGDSRETGKLTPDGKPDPSVFSTEFNREGIRVGTAVTLMVRRTNRARTSRVFFRQFWGVGKRTDILGSLHCRDFSSLYLETQPNDANRFSFLPLSVSNRYFDWPSIVSLCHATPISGLQEMRRGGFLDIDRGKLTERMRAYFDANLDWGSIKALNTGLTEKAGGFEPVEARKEALNLEGFDASKLRRYALYPFDLRWCYYTVVPTLWNRPRPELVAQCWPGNQFFVTRMFAERPHEQVTMMMTPDLPDYHLLRPNAVAIPIRLKLQSKRKIGADADQGDFLGKMARANDDAQTKCRANLSHAARAYLSQLGIKDADADVETAALLWMHALAIGYSPAYLAENADGIRQDWPRIALPDARATLLSSASLGQQVSKLLNTEVPVEGVTSGTLRAEMKTIGVLSSTTNLAVTAGWGHTSQKGITMPGKGKLRERSLTDEEKLVPEALLELGPSTLDVYLNEEVFWRNIPTKVWDYTIGGYQVFKKWLSYRERDSLDRALTPNEVRDVTHMVRRIAALVLLQPALDKNYELVKRTAVSWSEFSANTGATKSKVHSETRQDDVD